MGLMTQEALDLMHAWAPAQRWFPAKGRHPSLALVHEFVVTDSLSVAILRAATPESDWLLQVPISVSAAIPDDQSAVIGTLRDGRVLSDPTRGASARDLIAMVFGEYRVDGMRAEQFTPVDISHAQFRLLAGEQSNSSILVQGIASPTIVKFFRVLAVGENPDVQVTSALTRIGNIPAPRTYAALSADWGDGPGHLAVASELIEDAQDAWELVWRDALQAQSGQAQTGQLQSGQLQAGQAQTGQAHAGQPGDDLDLRGLGGSLARLHAALGEAFGVRPGTSDDAVALQRDLIERLDWARDQAGPALAELEDAVIAHRDQLASLPVPERVQRIHGDLHLGQVVRSARGWWFLDFEGEPLRPLADRARLDSTDRDLVGMLRSFAYAAEFAVQESGQDRAAATADWESRRTAEFLAGYRDAGGQAEEGPLMRALLIDKALYELVYELQNRPTWVNLPLAGLRALLTS